MDGGNGFMSGTEVMCTHNIIAKMILCPTYVAPVLLFLYIIVCVSVVCVLIILQR